MPISSLNQSPITSNGPQELAGLTMGTKVMTMEGELPVEFLSPGDRIVTRAGVRCLTAMSVRVERDVEMVRIGASTLGFDRPGTETLVPINQMILIRDWRAQALYGAPQALVAAGRLADGEMIKVETVAEARIFTLAFDSDVVIYADGLELECRRETVRV
jgi:Hint domain